MAKFTAYWLTGKAEVLEGRDFTEAFNKNYSAGALRALDFYGEGEPDQAESHVP